MPESERTRLIATLREEYGWTSAGFVIWQRASCVCEYCGVRVLSDRLSFRANAYDHILPKSRYKNLHTEEETRYYQGSQWLLHTGREYSNLALCCTRCNTQKSSWDPNGEEALVPLDVVNITLEQRDILIERVRQYLQSRWARDEAELDIARRWAETFEPT